MLRSVDPNGWDARGDRSSDLSVRSQAGGVVITLYGDHDLATKPLLLEALAGVQRGEQRVVIDLQHCTFVDSTIIGAILSACHADSSKKPDISVVMPDDTSYVYRALSVIGLRDLVPTQLSVEAALEGA
jgi:anti-anti-sigma factor